MSRWRDKEFNWLIKCFRAIYTFVGRVKEPGLHETVTWNLCSLRLPTVSPLPAGEPRLHDVRPRCSPRPLLPRTTGNTRSSRRLQALSPKSASPSAAPVPVSQPNILTRQLVPSRATPPITPRQQVYPVTPPTTPLQQGYLVTPPPHPASKPTQSHRHHTPPASLPSHTATTPRQQAYPVTPPPHPARKPIQSHRYHTPPASLPSHTATTPRLTIVTELETAKQDIKTELELHVHQLTDTVTSLTQKLTELKTKQQKN